MRDHDQRWKTLLREFLEDFFRGFFPEWAELLDFSHVEWLDKEVFPDPPEGKRRVLDVVARLNLSDRGRSDASLSENVLALIHVEIESGDSITSIHERMPRYFFHLRETYEIPVLPVVLFLRTGLNGIGFQEYREGFGPLETLCFRYLYAGLPALDGLEYLESGNPLGVAMSALMRKPADRHPWFKVEALQHLTEMPLDDRRKYLLAECVDAYLPLRTVQEQAEFERLLQEQQYEEANKMTAPTIYEEGLQQGKATGQRELLLELLESQFGPLSDEVRQRVEQLPPDQLPELGRKLLKAQSLAELGLDS
jgi:hypothetical protein